MIAMSKSKLRKNAKRLKAYMDFRAKKEFPNCNGSEHEFNTNFYYSCFKKGMRTFFGIECSSDGAIIRDNQNPVAYREFVGQKKSTDLKKEYVEVPSDKTCSIPLIQAIELLGLKKYDLPTIKTPAFELYETYSWLKDEKQKGLFGYNYHIQETKNHLKEDYPKLKERIRKQFELFQSGYSSEKRDEDVCQFINSALILEVNYFMDFYPKPMFENRTLH